MKKSTKEENPSNESMVSRLIPLQLKYNILWDKLNRVLNQKVKDVKKSAKTGNLPETFKNKLKK